MPAAFWPLLLRSDTAHCDLALAAEVPPRRRRTRRKRRARTKSNNTHLAARENCMHEAWIYA